MSTLTAIGIALIVGGLIVNRAPIGGTKGRVW